ncbi:ABC transporter permease [Bacillus cereus]|uniref:ABC transporter permease n=1 Tax=Bacillus cereus TaxID=1396 RepID=UPI00187A136C|nr:ABC transporter permease subunit [Bacillus cereus]MBE7105445.1 ABC transporter permease [Bacillus cereus]MBE7123733.1 ABC transporter permease [Bacillus cereus]
MWNILYSEWRSAVRSKSAYTFLLLWITMFSLIFVMERNTPALAGYTNVTGTMVNLILYIVPLLMLIIGAFSIAGEVENGKWRLLCTYPLKSTSYVIGKTIGQFIAQTAIFSMSFGVSIIIGLLSGSNFDMFWILATYIFSVLLIFLFLLLGITIGSFSITRWQALAMSIVVWFLLIMMWPTALISILNFVPYTMIAPLIKMLLFCNPAELLRIIFVIQLGGGAIFGQAYDQLIMFLQSNAVILVLLIYGIIYTTIFLFVAGWQMERRRKK